MFRWKELTLHGWDLWDEVVVPLDGDVTIISGENGSGKTTLIDSIRQLLNARTLSKKRRVQDYMKDPKRGVLIRGIVEQQPVDGQMPFRGEGVESPEMTIACTLRPQGGGAPEKRFLIEEGQVSPERITELTTSGGDWLRPEEYRRALRNAGISKSLMNVLTLSQGSIDELSQLPPGELFREVLDVLGDKEIIERYEEARENLRKAEERVAEHRRELTRVQDQLNQKHERLRVLEDYEDAQEELESLEARREAAKLQEIYAEASELREKLAECSEELEQTVRQRDESREELADKKDTLERLEVKKIERREEWEAAKEAYDDLHDENSRLHARIEELKEKEDEIENLPGTPVPEAREQWNEASEAHTRAKNKLRELESGLDDLKEKRERLQDGLPVYPEPVQATIEALDDENIDHQVMARTVELRDGVQAEAVESALGDLRFGLLVNPEDQEGVLRMAKKHDFPGPIFAGENADPGPSGPLELRDEAPAWMETELSDIDFEGAGLWSDQHGSWVRPPGDRLIGEEAIRRKLEETERRITQRTEERDDLRERLAELEQEKETAFGHLEQCRRREELREEVEVLPEIEAQHAEAQSRLQEAKDEKEKRHDEYETVSNKVNKLDITTDQLEKKLEELRERISELDTERTEIETRIESLDEDVEALEGEVRPGLQAEAKAGNLDSQSWLREKIGKKREELNDFEDVPAPKIRQEVSALENSINEVRQNLDQSNAVRQDAEDRVQRAKKNFLSNISHTLQRLRRRIDRYARMAGVTSEVEIPPTKDPDINLLEEGELRIRFGFDDKDPVLMRDPSFSGGQKVIAGLILLMAMADVEGPSFFVIDEPFAHLSVDRIDEVAEFLRATDSQFIITVPTGLARQDLEPGTQLIRLRKKSADDPYAPEPLRVIS